MSNYTDLYIDISEFTPIPTTGKKEVIDKLTSELYNRFTYAQQSGCTHLIIRYLNDNIFYLNCIFQANHKLKLPFVYITIEMEEKLYSKKMLSFFKKQGTKEVTILIKNINDENQLSKLEEARQSLKTITKDLNFMDIILSARFIYSEEKAEPFLYLYEPMIEEADIDKIYILYGIKQKKYTILNRLINGNSYIKDLPPYEYLQISQKMLLYKNNELIF